jgi:hypothetical protein
MFSTYGDFGGRLPSPGAQSPPEPAFGWQQAMQRGMQRRTLAPAVTESSRSGLPPGGFGTLTEWLRAHQIRGQATDLRAQDYLNSMLMLQPGNEATAAHVLIKRSDRLSNAGVPNVMILGETHQTQEMIPIIAALLGPGRQRNCVKFISEYNPVKGRAALVTGRHLLAMADQRGGLEAFLAATPRYLRDKYSGEIQLALAERHGYIIVFRPADNNGNLFSSVNHSIARDIVDAAKEGRGCVVPMGSAHVSYVHKLLSQASAGGAPQLNITSMSVDAIDPRSYATSARTRENAHDLFDGYMDLPLSERNRFMAANSVALRASS